MDVKKLKKLIYGNETGKGVASKVPQMHTMFLGPAATGKTQIIKDIIAAQENDCKIIISTYNEYHQTVQELERKGYAAVTLSAQDEETAISFNIERNKVIYINGYGTPPNYGEIWDRMLKSDIKIRIYIDGSSPYFNLIPYEMLSIARSHNCLFFSAFQDIKDLEKGLVAQFQTIQL
ncbi:hypothetical protein MOB18_21870 [Bacillus inaquosorum]|uniref:hypothetical protein n=1 Tax=Bacillus inaquosorum TaxID=483913 RepID=UPI002282BC25|nr:hypothetical protein [Bacillus inaquosorum]MCY7751708.1 hypothetical protein [Bacillus inaquosorum]